MSKKNYQCNLKDCFLCTYCITEWLPVIANAKKTIDIKKGQKVFNEDEPVTGIYFVYSGIIKVHKSWPDGRELILRFAKKGDVLGHMGLGSNPLYPVTATALEDSLVCYIPLSVFESTINVNPGFTYNLLKFFASELQEAEKRANILIHMQVKGRIALALLNLEKQFGTDPAGFISIVITKQDFASFAAVSYETLFKVMQGFFRDGIIEQNGKRLKLLNVNMLKVLCNETLTKQE